MDFDQNFLYKLIPTKSRLGLKMGQIYLFSTKLWLLIDIKIEFLLSLF